ncbi:MAG: sigma-70 family RNA polymerase sigma factor [Actinomycetota bacterium]|nr:sigma-70 family RNA polymerase sigma factor [Actinomycetota bacterium]
MFLAFYDDTFTEAYRYAGRLCGGDRDAAEDLVQDAYMSVLRQFRADPSRDLHVGYVITVIRNRHLDRLRAAAREQRRLQLVATDVGEPEPALMPSQLAGLPERDRAALVLRYVDDLSVPEVAEALDLTVHATESLLVRARARLRGKDVRHA